MGPEFLVINVFHRAIGTPLEKQLDPMDPIASRGGSVPVFLTRSIGTCDFLGGEGGGGHLPLDLPMQYHYNIIAHLFIKMKKLLTRT